MNIGRPNRREEEQENMSEIVDGHEEEPKNVRRCL